MKTPHLKRSAEKILYACVNLFTINLLYAII